MTEVSTSKLTSINMTAGEVYKAMIPRGSVCDIFNNTAGAIKVSFDSRFEEKGDALNYISIPEGSFYNGLRINGECIYLLSESEGLVSMVWM